LPVWLDRQAATAASAAIRETTPAIMAAVEQAIEDEIYDFKHERLYFEVDGNGGGDSSPAVISVHVSKTLTNGTGVAVYKDMPYGEVYRYFTVNDAGLVRLSGNAEGPFRDWGSSTLTVYMQTDVVTDFLTNKSIEGTFSVDPDVTPARIHAVIARQLERVGYSDRKQHRRNRPRQATGHL
jgi:hypothetical protein